MLMLEMVQARRREKARVEASSRRRGAKGQLERSLWDMFLRKSCETNREETVEELKGIARIQGWLAKTKVEMRCLLRTRVSEEERERLSGEVTEGWSVGERRPSREEEVMLDGERGWKAERFEEKGKKSKKVPTGWQSSRQRRSKWVSRPRQKRTDEKRKEELETKWWKFPSPGPPQVERRR